jgi:hypothetical protein
MSKDEIYSKGRYFTFYCEDENKWIVCVNKTNINSVVVCKNESFEDAKNYIDNGGAV